MIYQEDLTNARNERAQNEKFLNALKRKKPRKLDSDFLRLHEEVFDKIDCLSCANCCKTTSPIFIMADIERISVGLQMKPHDFIQAYLHLDEEGDYVLNSAPCPFLLDDNMCMVYKDRPRACREYPHTNRKRMHQILDLTFKNTLVCPAVQRIVNQMRTKS